MFRNMSRLKTRAPGEYWVTEERVHGSANGFVDKMLCGSFVLWGFKIDQYANDLTNELECSFNDRVCSGSVR